MEARTFQAKKEELNKVVDFIAEGLGRNGCEERVRMAVELAAEEIFINVASYAYPDGAGEAVVGWEIHDGELTLVFCDRGIPYNPLEKPDPDINAGADEREIGGLGIFMAKQYMDSMDYCYEDGENRLTLKKRL